MNRYRIPKDCAIDFMMTDEYEGFRMRVDAARFMKITHPKQLSVSTQKYIRAKLLDEIYGLTPSKAARALSLAAF